MRKSDPQIKLTAKSLKCSLEIDGQDIARSVTAVDVHIDAAHRMPVITLTMLTPAEMETEGRAVIDAKTAEALRILGWTPPPDDSADAKG